MTTITGNSTPYMPPVQNTSGGAVEAGGVVPSGALTATSDTAAWLEIEKAFNAVALAIPSPIGMSEEEYMLQLGQWADDFGALALANAKESLSQAIDMQKVKLKNKLADLKQMWQKQDQAAAAARRNRIIGWITKSITMVALVVAASVAVAAAVAAPNAGTIVLAGLLVMMAAAAATSFAGQAHAEIHNEQDAFSVTSLLQNSSGLSDSQGAYLGSFMSADLGALAAAVAAEITDDPEDLAIISGVFAAVQMLLMAGLAAANSTTLASKVAEAAQKGQEVSRSLAFATNKSIHAVQIGAAIVGGGVSMAEGSLAIETAKLELEISGIVAGLHKLNALLQVIDKLIKGQVDFQAEVQKHAIKIQEETAEIVLSINDRMLNVAQNLSPQHG